MTLSSGDVKGLPRPWSERTSYRARRKTPPSVSPLFSLSDCLYMVAITWPDRSVDSAWCREGVCIYFLFLPRTTSTDTFYLFLHGSTYTDCNFFKMPDRSQPSFSSTTPSFRDSSNRSRSDHNNNDSSFRKTIRKIPSIAKLNGFFNRQSSTGGSAFVTKPHTSVSHSDGGDMTLFAETDLTAEEAQVLTTKGIQASWGFHTSDQ